MLSPNPFSPLTPKPRRPGRTVHAILSNGTVKGVFPSAAEAASALGVGRNAVFCALRGGNRSCGWWWRYAVAEEHPAMLRGGRSPRRPIPTRYQPKPEPVTVVYAPRGEVVRGSELVIPKPARIPSGWKFGEHFADAADSVGSIAPDVVLDETLNPDRMGDDPRDIERVRFARARSYNPALTWPEWVALTTRRTPGRKPQPRGATR